VSEHELSEPRYSGTTDGLPIAPSLGPALEAAHITPRSALVDARVVVISALALLIALASGLISTRSDLVGAHAHRLRA